VYVLGCGSRDWSDFLIVREALSFIPEGSIVVHGNQRGADTYIDIEARNRGLKVIPVPAAWETLGVAAGPLRNNRMLEIMKEARRKGHATLVMAFHDDLNLGVGTRDMVKKALSAKMEVIIFLRVPFWE